MNEIRRPVREADEIAAIRAIVERHTMPDFVTGFDVELGSFHDEPSVWIYLYLSPARSADAASRSARVAALREYRETVHSDLLGNVANRYPYYHYVEEPPGASPQP